MGGVVGGKLVAVVVDAYAIDSHGLTDSEWTSMMVVASRVRDDGDLILSASNQTLAKWLRCSTRTVRRRREKLTQVGFLALIARGDGRGHASVYQINPHSLEGDRALSTFKGSQRGTTQAVKGDNSGRKGGHPAWPTRNKELRTASRAEPSPIEARSGGPEIEDVEIDIDKLPDGLKGVAQRFQDREQHEPQVTAVRLAPASPRVLGLLARLLLDPATDEDDTNE